MIALEWGAVSETGLVRAHNEDSYLAQEPVFAVADGMGGHLAGDVASAMTIEFLRPLLTRSPLSERDVARAIEAANGEIFRRGSTTLSMWGMGTTLVGLALLGYGEDAEWLTFNVGDSRLYRYADGNLEQLSHDHSEVQDLIDEGTLSERDALASAARNVLTRAIGTETHLAVDYGHLAPEPGERFLLCSDGLTNEVPDEEIADVLSGLPEPGEAAHELVRRAIEAGGRDNVTVIVVDVGEGEAALDDA